MNENVNEVSSEQSENLSSRDEIQTNRPVTELRERIRPIDDRPTNLCRPNVEEAHNDVVFAGRPFSPPNRLTLIPINPGSTFFLLHELNINIIAIAITGNIITLRLFFIIFKKFN